MRSKTNFKLALFFPCSIFVHNNIVMYNLLYNMVFISFIIVLHLVKSNHIPGKTKHWNALLNLTKYVLLLIIQFYANSMIIFS